MKFTDTAPTFGGDGDIVTIEIAGEEIAMKRSTFLALEAAARKHKLKLALRDECVITPFRRAENTVARALGE